MLSKLKIVFVGDCTVGKTSLIERIAHDKFHEYTQSTIGVAYHCGIYTKEDGKKIELGYWDTAGQERYASLIPMYYKNAAVCIFVYDIGHRETYLDVGSKWYAEFANKVDPDNVICYMLGNKVDVSTRKVSKEEANILAQSMNMRYFEISAKTGEGVAEFKEDLLKEVIKQQANIKIKTDELVKLGQSWYDKLASLLPSNGMCNIL